MRDEKLQKLAFFVFFRLEIQKYGQTGAKFGQV